MLTELHHLDFTPVRLAVNFSAKSPAFSGNLKRLIPNVTSLQWKLSTRTWSPSVFQIIATTRTNEASVVNGGSHQEVPTRLPTRVTTWCISLFSED
ncbi:hypothetical protein CC2G_014407 [Coprinopsis cinerea AmutBmut pab1-1]|nr:hypothetical protein CC2G_014407 [Coprinopsis cinerea AmutBmut pab1-1]